MDKLNPVERQRVWGARMMLHVAKCDKCTLEKACEEWERLFRSYNAGAALKNKEGEGHD